jgi:predicted NUDIX family NTP pyrophosphohydrolase
MMGITLLKNGLRNIKHLKMKATKLSAGVLVYKKSGNTLSVLLVHPGGPYWMKKDSGAWSIPKGEFEADESAFDAAKREFREETGFNISGNITDFIELASLKQKSVKTVFCFAIEGDLDPKKMHSNTFEMEWPPKSGKLQSFLEVDKAEWFPANVGLNKILEGQKSFILELAEKLGVAIDDNIEENGQLNLFSFD